MVDLKKSFYAIIPAYVRYDQELSSTAKLLYSEITALCNEKGYCWATNKYFAELYSLTTRQIQHILKQLEKKNYIKIIVEKKTKRKIFIIMHEQPSDKIKEIMDIVDYDWINE